MDLFKKGFEFIFMIIFKQRNSAPHRKSLWRI